MKVVNRITSTLAPVPNRLRAISCAEPAYTSSDMPTACHSVRPAAPARVPKIRPNGRMPTAMAKLSRIPREKSC
ncbi:hypothetical protein D3C81_2118100 [compost metagenome]